MHKTLMHAVLICAVGSVWSDLLLAPVAAGYAAFSFLTKTQTLLGEVNPVIYPSTRHTRREAPNIAAGLYFTDCLHIFVHVR